MDHDYYNLDSKETTDSSAHKPSDELYSQLLKERVLPSPQRLDDKTIVEVVNVGEIESFILPKGWQPLPQDANPSHDTNSLDFVLPETGKLSIKEKGFRISEEAGSHFVKALKCSLDAKTHTRTIDLNSAEGQKELDELKPVLAEDLANANKFKPEIVRIKEITGRRVMEIIGTRGNRDDKGVWKASDERVSEIYIDKFGKGDAIQQIRLQTKQKSFTSLHSQLAQAMKSLKWKESGSRP